MGCKPSKVDPQARKKVVDSPAIQEKRKHIFAELVTTEKRYVRGLEVMAYVYMKPMEEKALLPDKTIKQIFSVSENLMLFHRTFLSTLEGLLASWSNSTLIAEHFLRMKPYLKMYYDYVNNYAAASEVLKGVTENKKKVAKFLANPYEDEKEIKYSDYATFGGLPSLLITPVQRLPRYNLLLDEFTKKTPDDHPDFDKLNEALAAMKEATESVNESKRSAEEQLALLRVDEELSGKCKGLIVAHRKFVMQDEIGYYDFTEEKKPKEKKGMLYLFNDCLILAAKTKSLIGKENINFLFKLSILRCTITDSKTAYATKAAPDAPSHPIRAAVDATGSDPNVMFYVRMDPPGADTDPMLGKVRSSISVSVKSQSDSDNNQGPLCVSIVFASASRENAAKWVSKFNEMKDDIFEKNRTRREIISKVHGQKSTCTCIIS